MQLNWIYKSFYELTPKELYAILHLRSEVFVVEQNCVYLDMDFKDEKSFHLAGWDGDNLVAYVRIVPPGISFEDPSIGRVVTSPAYRKSGAGRQLMNVAIEKTLQQFNHRTITIGAQLYLKQFYGSLGFVQISEQYTEDGIPHIHMQFTAEN